MWPTVKPGSAEGPTSGAAVPDGDGPGGHAGGTGVVLASGTG